MNDAIGTPVTPADPKYTLDVAGELWGSSVSSHLEKREAALRRRALRINDLRAMGEAGMAETLGWITLAAVLCGASSKLVATISPGAVSDIQLRRDSDDRLPEPLIEGVRPAGHGLLAGIDEDLGVTDPTDPVAFAIADLAASSVRDSVVVIDGADRAAPRVREELFARIRGATGG